MKKVKSFSVILLTVLFLSSFIVLPAHAVDPVSALGLASALDAYGMAYGVGTVYDVSSNAGISDNFSGLWDDFSAYQNANNADVPTVNGVATTYEDYISDWQENYRSLHAFEHSSGKFAAFYIDAESAAIFDKFWNWLLTGPAEMVAVDNQYFQFSQSQIGSTAQPIICGSLVSYSAQVPYGTDYSVGLVSLSYESYYIKLRTTQNEYPVVAFAYPNGYEYRIICVSTGNVSCVASSINSSTGNISGSKSASTNNYNSSSSVYYSSTTVLHYSQNGATVNIPYFSSFSDGLAASAQALSSPIVDSTVGVKSDTDSGIVTLPVISNPDYTPTPIDIVTTVPWNSTYDDNDEVDDNGIPVPVPFPADSVPDMIDDIGDSISAEDFSLLDDPQNNDPDNPSGPQEFFLPFIPVGIPSFNFNLSGIWHYVREWIASLGAWFTMVLSVWAILPWAMVVPVYASLVVVIVLGVYKRFFM